jgi:hypothetical protein
VPVALGDHADPRRFCRGPGPTMRCTDVTRPASPRSGSGCARGLVGRHGHHAVDRSCPGPAPR